MHAHLRSDIFADMNRHKGTDHIENYITFWPELSTPLYFVSLYSMTCEGESQRSQLEHTKPSRAPFLFSPLPRVCIHFFHSTPLNSQLRKKNMQKNLFSAFWEIFKLWPYILNFWPMFFCNNSSWALGLLQSSKLDNLLTQQQGKTRMVSVVHNRFCGDNVWV